ncbi:MAG TPA: helix-turn-helix transcriptional regulator [Caldisericia bacterium]|nr:helix-turn-helix transcriptional regulator [Caldisericia bacterium]
MTIVEKFKKLREDFGLSQEESDEKLEVRRQAIYQIEKGLRTPGIKFIKNRRCF